MTKPEGLSGAHVRIVHWDCYSRRVHLLTRSFAQRALYEVEPSE